MGIIDTEISVLGEEYGNSVVMFALELPGFIILRSTLPLSTRIDKIWVIKSMITTGSEFHGVLGHGGQFGSISYMPAN